jgi:hypothetical protein
LTTSSIRRHLILAPELHTAYPTIVSGALDSRHPRMKIGANSHLGRSADAITISISHTDHRAADVAAAIGIEANVVTMQFDQRAIVRHQQADTVNTKLFFTTKVFYRYR